MNAALRSQSKAVLPSANFYVVDTLDELKSLYRLSPIAVVGGSFIQSQGLSGHNLSEAAAAGCAVLIGPPCRTFLLDGTGNAKVKQVSGKIELLDRLRKLLSIPKILKDYQTAARKT